MERFDARISDAEDPRCLDVGQNGRPRGPQMEMSSLVLTIHNFGVPNFDPYPYIYISNIINIWRCLKIGSLQNHPFIYGFSIIHHPAIGVPPFVGTSNKGFFW